MLSLAVLLIVKNYSDKLRIAIERWSKSTDAEQMVPAKNILGAIQETIEERALVQYK